MAGDFGNVVDANGLRGAAPGYDHPWFAYRRADGLKSPAWPEGRRVAIAIVIELGAVEFEDGDVRGKAFPNQPPIEKAQEVRRHGRHSAYRERQGDHGVLSERHLAQLLRERTVRAGVHDPVAGRREPVRELGARVIEALDIGTSATHMEWFFGPKGLRFSEIGCRPPGVGAWDLYSAANDVDVYREWAHVLVHGRPDRPMNRAYSAGIVALRPERDGRIRGYSGLDEINQRHGEWIIDAHLPDPGTGTQPVEAGYMANAWIRLRHPDFDTTRAMLDDVGRTVQVHAG
jgi:hypothetical protein